MSRLIVINECFPILSPWIKRLYNGYSTPGRQPPIFNSCGLPTYKVSKDLKLKALVQIPCFKFGLRVYVYCKISIEAFLTFPASMTHKLFGLPFSTRATRSFLSARIST